MDEYYSDLSQSTRKTAYDILYTTSAGIKGTQTVEYLIHQHKIVVVDDLNGIFDHKEQHEFIDMKPGNKKSFNDNS